MMDQAKVKKELRVMLGSGLESFKILRPLEDSMTELRKEDLVAEFLTDNLVSEPVIIPNGGYGIEVKTLTGKTIEICVKNTYTILDLKEEIHKADKIPADQQRIIWSGKEREDECTLNELNIEKGSKVHLVLRLRMGLDSSMARKKPEQVNKVVPMAPSIQPEKDGSQERSTSLLSNDLNTQNAEGSLLKAEGDPKQSVYQRVKNFIDAVWCCKKRNKPGN